MGKPTNTKKQPCSIAASDCIIWTGKDICFINHCDKASVTEIIEGLGTEVCRHRDILNPAEYDTECLNFDCPPKSFKEIITRLIELGCNNGCNSTSSTSEDSCCDTQIVVPTCFQEQGTVQSLLDYVQNIGNKVCEQELIIQNQQATISNLVQRLNSLETQVNNLIGN